MFWIYSMGNHRENLRVNVGKHRLSHLGELFDGAKENDNFGSFFATVEREFKVSKVLMLNSDTVYCLSHNLILCCEVRLISAFSCLVSVFVHLNLHFCNRKWVSSSIWVWQMRAPHPFTKLSTFDFKVMQNIFLSPKRRAYNIDLVYFQYCFFRQYFNSKNKRRNIFPDIFEIY